MRTLVKYYGQILAGCTLLLPIGLIVGQTHGTLGLILLMICGVTVIGVTAAISVSDGWNDPL